MEAMTACSIALLTIYDMCKSADRSMVIGDVTLWEKTGGRSGTYRRDPTDTLGFLGPAAPPGSMLPLGAQAWSWAQRRWRRRPVPRPPPPVLRAGIVGATCPAFLLGGGFHCMLSRSKRTAAALAQPPRLPTTNTRRRRWAKPKY
jgi:hypothetical protein